MDQMIGNTASTAGLIKDSNMQSFAVDVLEASRERPVIVDFWSERSGQCKQLMLKSMPTRTSNCVHSYKYKACQL